MKKGTKHLLQEWEERAVLIGWTFFIGWLAMSALLLYLTLP